MKQTILHDYLMHGLTLGLLDEVTPKEFGVYRVAKGQDSLLFCPTNFRPSDTREHVMFYGPTDSYFEASYYYRTLLRHFLSLAHQRETDKLLRIHQQQETDLFTLIERMGDDINNLRRDRG